MSEPQRPSQAECTQCKAALILIPSNVFRTDEAAAAQLDLGTARDPNADDEIVAHFALLYADGHYVCPVCNAGHQA